MSPDAVIIRRSLPADRPALLRVAALDSRPLPEGDLLLAERDGRPLAAVSIAAGEAVADPFAPTAELVGLLRLRAAQIAGDAPARRGLRRLWPAAGRRWSPVSGARTSAP